MFLLSKYLMRIVYSWFAYQLENLKLALMYPYIGWLDSFVDIFRISICLHIINNPVPSNNGIHMMVNNIVLCDINWGRVLFELVNNEQLFTVWSFVLGECINGYGFLFISIEKQVRYVLLVFMYMMCQKCT